MQIKLLCAAALMLTLSLHADPADDVVADYMKHHPIPGVSLLVVKDGQPIKSAAYGMANLELQVPVKPETVFEIGSVSKQFTAAGIMLLVQDGKISVDDKISQYLKGTPEAWKDITIRHCLTHTSGIKNYTGLDGFELTKHLPVDQFIKRMSEEPMDFKPGEKWKYCNTGFNLLGHIIESVSGKKYWDYMNERIFHPLGMTHTVNRFPGTVIPNRASGYETNRAGKYINRDYDLTDIFSAGEIVSTVGDLAKWDAALDTDQLLNADTKKAIWTPVKLNDGSTHEYGFGWFLNPLKGHKNIGHSGSTSGFSASNQRFPDDGLVVILLTNSGEDGIATKVAKSVAEVYLKK